MYANQYLGKLSSALSRTESQSRGFILSLVDNFDDIRTDWLELEKEAFAGPFQTLSWCESWWNEVGIHSSTGLALVTSYSRNGKLGFILPLIKRKVGLFSIAQTLGDKNAAYLGAMYTPNYLKEACRAGKYEFERELRELIPDVDIYVLNSQALKLNSNGLIGQEFNRLQTASDISMTFLEDDWTIFDAKQRSSKARSKERNRENRLKKMGEFEFCVATSAGERLEMFEALAKQKSEWFQAHGIADIFACKSNLKFLRQLTTTDPDESRMWAVLSGLKLDGEWIAMNMGVIHRDQYAGLILSTGEGEAKKFSPGNLLITKTMQYCTEQGIKTFNFGAGQNELKSKWVDKTETLVIATLPNTIKGLIYQSYIRTANRVKKEIKSNPHLWQRFQGLRALSAK